MSARCEYLSSARGRTGLRSATDRPSHDAQYCPPSGNVTAFMLRYLSGQPRSLPPDAVAVGRRSMYGKCESHHVVGHTRSYAKPQPPRNLRQNL
jgi:hypothetical protein